MSVLLLDVGASAPALPNLVPVAQVYGRWAPAVYQFPEVPVPGAFAATALADAVLLTWSAVPRATYVIERASNVAGAPGTWSEIERTTALAIGFPVAAGTTYWWRVRAIVFGRSSDRTAAVMRAPTNMNAALGDLASNLATVSGVATAAQAAANASLTALADIASDSLLTPDEKPDVMRDYSVITSEQAGIDSEANDYRIVAEKTAYDAAVSALTAYLDTLTAPKLWTDLTGNTNIVGVTFRAKFANVYTKRQALLNAITAVIRGRVTAAQGPNLAVNYTFFGTTGLWGDVTGSAAALAGSTVDGYLRATVPAGWSSNYDLYESHWFDVSPSDVFFVSALVSAYGSTHSSQFGLVFRDGTGALTWKIAGTVAAGVGSTPVSGSIAAPAGAVQAMIWAAIPSAVAGDKIALKNVICERSLLMQPGSGAQLGDARNQAMVTVGNFGSAWSGLSVTWTTTTASATLTASAATLQVGSAALSYNSSSVTVSGTAGSTTTFYLYYDDANYAGGSRTLNATTSYINSINNNGRVYVAEARVTFPTSGTGGGGGAGGEWDCVDYDSVLPDGRMVRDLQVGDLVECVDVRTGARGWFPLQSMRFGCANCYRVTTTHGEVIQSDTTPMDMPDGSIVRTPDLAGCPVLQREHGFEPAAIEFVGMRRVCKPDLGNRMFFAGTERDRTLATHNIRNKRPGDGL